MKKYLLMFLIVFLIFIKAFSDDLIDYKDYILTDSYNEAFSMAKLTGTGVILLFSLPGCGNCEDLKEYTFSNSKVKDFLSDKFVITTVDRNDEKMGYYPPDPEKSKYVIEYDYSYLYSIFEIRTTPTLIVLDNNFDRIGRIEGFVDSEILIEEIERIICGKSSLKKGAVKKITVDDYKVLRNAGIKFKALKYAELLGNNSPDTGINFLLEDFEEGNISVLTEYALSNGINVYYIHSASTEITNIEKQLPLQKEESEEEKTVREIEEECSGKTDRQTITITQARQIVSQNKSNPDFVIIDLRTPQEYATGHLENSVNLDFFSSAFENTLRKMNKDKTYLIYCKSGGRSIKAYDKMIQLGFKNIYHMCAGYEGWINE